MSVCQSKPVVCALLIAGLSLSSVALAQGVHNNQHLRFTQEHGITFSTIGDAGNPAYTYFNINQTASVGRVDYEYRIATTETTVAQYARFVDVYRHFVPQNEAINLAGNSLGWLGNDAAGSPAYAIPSGWESRPAYASFRYFARMANWLHHGAPDLANASHDTFAVGAYDDTVTGTRTPGARVWIPSRDEWVKAAHWDPNRNGPGEGGYWLFPDASDEQLMPGDPAMGGETSAGNAVEWPSEQFRPWDVGSYGDVQTPWGLLDASGGAREWTEDRGSPFNTSRLVLSTGRSPTELTPGDQLYRDRIELFHVDSALASGRYVTARFAMAVPSPGVLGIGGIAVVVLFRRSR
ncbi:SUMF1/EgtB/PvdO family nonheme iron enzyme [Pseudanabaena sp. CCNP1317]|uniref:SUMF1/EgtB/PvdO family nonheme iron enzyme n=1 Tax=Pseudanabaena sp. CCNP1317 TaxID=3110253 RepID=UPI002B21EAA5|nr:SUMF1/EgtB/PvdO family nonheme iron enzyme [Pseudanabaena sp. CCNP1317]MEA5486626.1 SUMF1/EgtB/PvdO family nonheme iron enzyme [Pseudanabaena sp. CCNP1317]